MPLPATPLTVHGGCNCRAVRYTIQIPVLSERLLHPSVATRVPPELKDTIACRLPFVTWDHCNDCRNATGALLPAFLCTPASTVTVTCVLSDSALTLSEENRQYPEAGIAVPAGKFPMPHRDGQHGLTAAAAEYTITQPGLDLLAPPFTGASAERSTWLRNYGSSEGRTRTFCGRCGTPLVYNVRPMPAGWPEMLDFVLGTIDREDLERETEDGGTVSGGFAHGLLQPERQLWWERGIPWLRRVVQGFEGPKHDSYAPDEEITDL